MQRGEIWWADMPLPVGRRPVVLLSRNAAYDIRNAVTVAPVTRTIRNIKSEVCVGSEQNLPYQSVINLDDMATVPKEYLTQRITQLSGQKIAEVEQAIIFSLGIKTANL